MSLYDEEEVRRKNAKSKKTKKLVITGIILTIVLIIVLMVAITFLIANPNKITVSLDGKQSAALENMLITKTENDGTTEIYFPIREFAKSFGYTSNNGEYTTNLEDKNSCNVDSGNEISIFKLDSNIIYKLEKNTNSSQGINQEYEYIKINNPVIQESDTLYASMEGIEKAFNFSITYNNKTKKMSIYTLDYLLTTAQSKAEKLNAKVDELFANKKTILDNMIVLNYDNRRAKGVINYTTGAEILGGQYEDIKYVSSKKVFIVKANGKIGIYGDDGQMKISPQYDSLTLIDNENDLYLAEYNKRYGVVDINGQTKIYLDYDAIGVDVNNYKENGLRNGYVFFGKLIPVKQNNLWRFYRIESEKNADGTKNVQCRDLGTNFDAIGCITTTRSGTTSNLMVIEDYEVVVVKKNNHYGFMDTDGKPAIGLKCSDVYMETMAGNTNYYMVSDIEHKTENVIEELEKMGYTKVSKE